MISFRPFSSVLLCLVLALALSACTTLSYVSPDTVNFSGEWVIDPESSDLVAMPKRRAGGNSARSNQADSERGQRGDRGGNRGSRESRDSQTTESGQSESPMGNDSVRINSSNTREMTIEHSADSIGIIFPNGRIRDIDWGKIDRRHQETTAGWDGEKLIVKTVGLRGTIVEEFWLDSSGEVLTISFDVRGRDFVRVYKRKTEKSESPQP